MNNTSTKYAIVVGREHIESGNILPVLKAISKIESLGDPYQSIIISFHGYDDIPDELWELNPVRRWVAKLINRVPHLFYYVENDVHATRDTLMLCVSDFESFLHGERKSPNETFEEGTGIEDVPQHSIKVKIHQKSYKEMVSKLRRYAAQKRRRPQVEELISEMNKKYNQEA